MIVPNRCRNHNRQWRVSHHQQNPSAEGLLGGRDARHFRFSFLQRVSPDMDAQSGIALENLEALELCALGRMSDPRRPPWRRTLL